MHIVDGVHSCLASAYVDPQYDDDDDVATTTVVSIIVGSTAVGSVGGMHTISPKHINPSGQSLPLVPY
jgi:hypothetical protein